MSDHLDRALTAIDDLHRQDPDRVAGPAGEQAAELVYAQRMSEHLLRLEPTASEALQIAVRCQHLMRWTLTRDEFPEGRAGYRQWRSESSRRHAEMAAKCVVQAGYDQAFADRVSSLVRKQRLASSSEAQTLEDVACLVFIEHHLEDFARKHAPDKLRDILRKTWNKMSERGHSAALQISLPAGLRAVVVDAVS